MAGVGIRGVHKHFGSTHVIRGVDIAIADGEFCVLVGPSGCGKSTLLRMIAGLEEIGTGEIAIGGTVVNRVPPKERDIAMVFQNYALYPHMTVRDNMSFALMLAKRTKEDIGERVQKAADILGLAPYLDRYPRQLSGGQRQRVAMGRAIVRDPQVFLFDEPLSNLDAKLRVQMRTEIKELHQRLEDHVDLRDARPDRGDDDGRQDRRDARRHRRADRRPARPLRSSGEHVRRGIHRLAGDEHRPRHRTDGRRRALASNSATASCCPRPRAPAPPTDSRCSTACGPSTARSRPPACRSKSSSSSRPAPTRSSIVASRGRKSPRPSATAPIAAPATGSTWRPILRGHISSTRRAVAARRRELSDGQRANTRSPPYQRRNA